MRTLEVMCMICLGEISWFLKNGVSQKRETYSIGWLYKNKAKEVRLALIIFIPIPIPSSVPLS